MTACEVRRPALHVKPILAVALGHYSTTTIKISDLEVKNVPFLCVFMFHFALEEVSWRLWWLLVWSPWTAKTMQWL